MYLTQDKLVLVTWRDSRGLTDQWEPTEELQPLETVLCESVGFLLEDGPDHKTLVMTTSEDQILGQLSIPAGAIVGVERLVADGDTDEQRDS